jgi:hypothetical protein
MVSLSFSSCTSTLLNNVLVVDSKSLKFKHYQKIVYSKNGPMCNEYFLLKKRSVEYYWYASITHVFLKKQKKKVVYLQTCLIHRPILLYHNPIHQPITHTIQNRGSGIYNSFISHRTILPFSLKSIYNLTVMYLSWLI